jgi:putative NIF3 family GTP cyclohydrolase 1 type 2
MIGELEQPMTTNDFLSFLKEKMKTQTIRYTKLQTSNPKLQTVAVCGGAGSFLLKEAIASGANAFITGDFKYHQFFDAENKIMICDIGHYESEQFTPEIFAEVLRRKFPTFATRFTFINTNPINYY